MYVTLFFANFDPLSLSHSVTHTGTPQKVRHTSRTPSFSVGLVQNSRQKPNVQILSQLFAGFFKGVLVWKVLSGVILSVPLRSEYFCYNRKLNITLNFRFHMYAKKFISVTEDQMSQASRPPPPVTNCYTISDPLPLERDVLYGRPQLIQERCDESEGLSKGWSKVSLAPEGQRRQGSCL